MDLLEKIRELRDKLQRLYKLYVPQFTVPRYRVSYDWVHERLKKLPNWEDWRWIHEDASFYTTTLQGFKKIIEWDWTDHKKYIGNVFDCENFSQYFRNRVAIMYKVNAVAAVYDYSSQHAYVLILPWDRDKPLIHEPQTDEIIELEKRNKIYYAMEDYIVMI